MSDGAQLARPVWIIRIHAQLLEHFLGDTVEQCRLARYVPIKHCRVPTHLITEATHRQAVDTVTVD